LASIDVFRAGNGAKSCIKLLNDPARGGPVVRTAVGIVSDMLFGPLVSLSIRELSQIGAAMQTRETHWLVQWMHAYEDLSFAITH